MTYVEKTLGRGETIVARAEISKLPVVVWSIIAAGLFVLTAAGFDFELAGLVAGLIIAVAVVSRPLITAFSTELSLTNRRVVGKTGLIKTKTLDFPIKKINSIYVEQKLFGKIFNYSTVNISSASGVFQYDMVKNAESFRQLVSEQIDAYEAGGAASLAYAPAAPAHEEIKKCRKCGAVISADAAFCSNCGSSTAIADEPPKTPAKKDCPHCGAAIDADALFCSFCGRDTRKTKRINPIEEERPAPAEHRKKCVNCGSLVEEEAIYCPVCGKKADFSAAPAGTAPKQSKPKGFSTPTDLD